MQWKSIRKCLILMKEYKKFLTALHTVYRTANSTLNTQDFVKGLLKILQTAFSTSNCSISYYHSNSPSLYYKVTFVKNKYFTRQGKITILQKEEKDAWEKEKTIYSKYKIVIPLIFIDNMGVLTIKRRRKDRLFRESEKKLVSIIGEEVAVVLRNFQLYEENRKTIVASIRTITKMLRNYTPTSRIHVEYLYKIIKELGISLNLTESQSTSLRYAFLLHDTGKIEVPQRILSKHAPLTKEEREAIKKHPKEGAKLLKDFSILRPVIPIILYHHERYDGKGYPSGLKKKHIPFEARIMSIVDAFDAMFFGRHYKKRMSLENIIKELETQKGKQFDPEIVEKFISILKKREIKEYLESIRRKKHGG